MPKLPNYRTCRYGWTRACHFETFSRKEFFPFLEQTRYYAPDENGGLSHGRITEQWSQTDYALPARLHSSVGRASHRHRGGHGFESRSSLIIFLGFISNCLRYFTTAKISFTSFLYPQFTHIIFIIYTSHHYYYYCYYELFVFVLVLFLLLFLEGQQRRSDFV